MFSVWDRQERPPEEGTAAGLQGFGVDKTFLSSLKGILLETELVTAVSPSLCPHLSHPSSLAQLCAGLLCSPFHRPPPTPRFSVFPLSGLPSATLSFQMAASLSERATECIIHRQTEVRWKDTFLGYQGNEPRVGVGGGRTGRRSVCLPPASRRAASRHV